MHEPGSCSTSQTWKTKETSWNDRWSGQSWFSFFKRPIFSSGSFVVHLWRQRSSDQDDHKGKMPDNETCFQNPQSLLFICFLIQPIWTLKSKLNTLTPKTNSLTERQNGNFTRDERNHLLCLFNISHLTFINCLEVMSKKKKNARRCSWRKSRSKIEADDDFGLAMQRNGS